MFISIDPGIVSVRVEIGYAELGFDVLFTTGEYKVLIDEHSFFFSRIFPVMNIIYTGTKFEKR